MSALPFSFHLVILVYLLFKDITLEDIFILPLVLTA